MVVSSVQESQQRHMTVPSTFSVEFHFIAQASGVNKQKKKNVLKPKALEYKLPGSRIVSESKLEIRGLNGQFQFPLVMKGGLLLNSNFSRPIARRQCRQTTEPTSPRSLGRIQLLKTDYVPMGGITIRERKLLLDDTEIQLNPSVFVSSPFLRLRI